MTLRSSRHPGGRTADVGETARELALDVEPEDGTELLQFHDKT